MKTNLFDCKVGDKVVYITEGLTGIITRLNSKLFAIKWNIMYEEEDDDSNAEHEQEISYSIYKGNDSWQKVYQYDDEKELLMLMLKYSPS